MTDAKPDIILTVTKEGVDLKKRGRDYWGLSPFRNEKKPSLKVSAEKQRWFDFGENSGGDVIDFVMKLHGLSFKDACKYLNIIPGKRPTPDPALQRKKNLQREYDRAIHNLWETLCARGRYLHGLRIQVEQNPGALTETGAVTFANRMAELAEVDYKLDTLLKGNFEDKIFLLKTMRGKNELSCGTA